MARLSDLIKRGKLPEKEKDDVKIRDLASLKETHEFAEVAPGKKPVPEEISDNDLPTENTKGKPVEGNEEKTVEDISLPSEYDVAAISTEELNEKERIEGFYTNAREYLEGIINNLKRKQRFTIEKGVQLVNNIVSAEKAVDILYGKAIQSKDMQNSLVIHSVNVCIYALMLGIGVGYSRVQLTELGISALLHDLGMIFIPEEIVRKSEKLSKDEIEILRKHPYYTYKILQAVGGKYSWIADIVYQEQEREGGQGYPRGLKGEEIHDYAKIIGVVDVYDALTHQRPQREKYMPHEAVKLIISTQKDLFSNDVKRLLLTKLSCFPLGSLVKLNSKSIGKVTEINEGSPLRPTIEILFDSRGHRLPRKKVIKLIEAPLLYIIGTVLESDLPV